MVYSFFFFYFFWKHKHVEKKRSLNQRTAEDDSQTFVPAPRNQMNPSGLRYGEDYLAERDLLICQGIVPDQYRQCKTVVNWYVHGSCIDISLISQSFYYELKLFCSLC